MIKMPPQAYTKEVLSAAFDWLSNQPEYVRQRIASSDDLVGLYLKSTRLKTDFNKDLTSAKNFRNELQDLAQNLKQFEEKEESKPATNARGPATGPSGKDEVLFRPQQGVGVSSEESRFETSGASYGQGPQGVEPPRNGQTIEMGPFAGSSAPPSMIRPSGTQIPNPEPSPNMPVASKPNQKVEAASNLKMAKLAEGEIVFKLDQKTLSALNLAKDRLNLSSDTEALRVLVSLGEKHLKKLFSTED